VKPIGQTIQHGSVIRFLALATAALLRLIASFCPTRTSFGID
jgi:hypothetical protein